MQPHRNWMIHLFTTLAMLLVAIKASAADRPNILLIVSDDQGYNDLGQLGNGIITPALDRLANEGTRLTNFYVAWPACTPSRASLLTGRYPQRNGIYDMIRNEAPDYGHRYTPDQYAVTFERIGGMDEREVIIPAVLKRAGYKSGIYGKWDLGALRRMLPNSRGFDDFYGFVNTGIDYFTHERYGVPCMVRNLEPTEEDKGTYCTYLFQREALRFLDEHAGEEPFFLYVPFNAPHNSSSLDPKIRSSVQAPERFKAMYPPVESETRVTDRYRYGTPATVATPQARRRDYRAAVTCMDAAIGEMLDRLEAKQMLEDTIVVFFSDNGGSGGADNSPLRGHKAQTWEGGIRVPCIVRWTAGKIPAGAVNDEFLTSLELLPSFASAAGLEPPADIVLDGFDWWPTLRGESASPREEMFWKRRDQIGARVGQWKWVQMGKQGGLFNLANDMAETHDLSESRPQILAMVKDRYANWLREMEAAEPRGPFRDF
ncbi:sulfatase family protein [Rhodopirellula europaea]|uniref:N-acetylgalactosamine 6-sulfate sulfatase (GALNS) n=1 Tax=Rhodopirellula europaea 6C TaxID=1263867 RepID=M2A3H5_9BACT|nr:sulfatase-like hydrolase/transferase [Rhodopirellula europaea]EMB13631.1 N-acetylgalactosamine 6-sulfate sulfatase (GALNS) [Rhodopirellula europaea 6C]